MAFAVMVLFLASASAEIQRDSGVESDFSTVDYVLESDSVSVSRTDAVEVAGEVSGLDGLEWDDDYVVDVGFEYREGGSSSWSFVDAGELVGEGVFDVVVDGFEPGSEVEVRAVADSFEASESLVATTREFSQDSANEISFSIGDKFLKWESNDAVDGFKVYSDETGEFEEIKSIDLDVGDGSEALTGVQAEGGEVCYYVTAFVDDNGDIKESPSSGEVCRGW